MMKKVKKVCGRGANYIQGAIFSLSLLACDIAMATGLSKVKTVANSFQTQILAVVPAVATVVLILVAIGFAFKFVQKATFAIWAIGLIIVGSATEITKMFIS